MFAALKPLYAYRGFVIGSVKRDFQSRYRRSMLGAAWLFLQPLAMILVYTLIFSQVMRAKLPGVENTFGYSIYLCAGTLTWGLFAEILGRGQSVFIDNANLLKKINFPRICLPAIVSSTALLNFAIIFGLFTVFLVASGSFPGWAFFGLIPLLLLQVAFALGLGMALGVLNVFFRDVGQIMGVLLQFWFWCTPIVYPVSIIPAWAHQWLMLNPMARLVISYQDILVRGGWPDWLSLWPVVVEACFMIWLGMHFFRKHSADMVDEL